MTAAYRIIVAGLKDLSTVSVICECGSALSLNIETARIPHGCASRGKQYSENVMASLAGLGRFHREGAAAEQHSDNPVFRFEIRQSE